MLTLKDELFILEYILENTSNLTIQEMNMLDELVENIKFRYYEIERGKNK